MKFTWHEKFTRAVEKVPDELLPELIRAVLAYGTDGVEPELRFPLDAIFESMREDIDCSHTARTSGAAGGRGGKGSSKPRRPARADQESALYVTFPVEEDGCEPSAEADRVAGNGPEPDSTCEPPSETDSACETLSESNSGLETLFDSDTQYITVQDSTEQDSAREKAAQPVSRKPPSAEEVRAYAFSAGLHLDPEAFCDFYASKGWRVGKEPMRDWKAAVRNWARNDHRYQRAAPARGGSDVYSAL